MKFRRRGTFLVEMLTVIFMVGIGGTLMSVGLASLLRSQNRVATFGNQFARVNDFLGSLERDVRKATTATLHNTEGGEPRQILTLGETSTRVSYRFFENHVERSERGTETLLSSISTRIGLVNGTDGRVGVNVIVLLPRSDGRDPEPHRQFHRLYRCAGAIYDEQ